MHFLKSYQNARMYLHLAAGECSFWTCSHRFSHMLIAHWLYCWMLWMVGGSWWKQINALSLFSNISFRYYMYFLYLEKYTLEACFNENWMYAETRNLCFWGRCSLIFLQVIFFLLALAFLLWRALPSTRSLMKNDTSVI